MHLYVLARGIKPHLDKWQNDLLAQWVPMHQNGKPKVEQGMPVYIQLAVRPIQLFEIVFPEEEVDAVMGLCGAGSYMLDEHPSLNFGVKTLRKVMGLETPPIPSVKHPLMQPHPLFKSVDITPIGLKKDKFNAEGVEQL